MSYDDFKTFFLNVSVQTEMLFNELLKRWNNNEYKKQV